MQVSLDDKVYRVDIFKPTWMLTQPEIKLLYLFKDRKSVGEIKEYVNEKLKEDKLGFYDKVDYENIQRYINEYIYMLEENKFIC